MDDENKTAWFILVERENNPSKLIGPYDDEAVAIKEMEDGLYVESLAQEDALEIMVIQLEIMELNPLISAIVYELPPEYDVGGTLDEHGIGVFAHGAQEVI